MATSSGAVKSGNPDYTHFVSLPLLLHDETVTKLTNFQKSVLGTTKVNQGLEIEKSMFINPKSFHLTVLMLKLSNNDQIKAAAEVLRSVSPKVTEDLEGRPVSIRLTGLACMRGSPEKAYVVYAPLKVIGGDARLERACQRIIDAFTEAGLVLQEDANKKLKLHATLMNARYRKSKKSSEKTDPFDARTIFGQYGSEEWGECRIHEAHLSKSKKSSEKTDPFDARTIFGQYGSEEWGECRIHEAHLSKRKLHQEIGSVALKAYAQTPNI